MWETLKETRIYLLLLFFCALALRVWFISGNNVLFWYDQARDAAVVEKMVKNADLTIQGPSASGTNDTVYHGVLYYYVIAPFYCIFSGNPTAVAGVLGFLNSLTILPLFLLLYQLTHSKKYSLLGCFLFAFSFEQVQLGTWLSNPTLAIPSMLLFYFFLWRVFWQRKTHELVWVALFAGLTQQAIIFSVYLLGAGSVALAFQLVRDKKWIFSWKEIVSALVVYVLSVSTLLLNQVLLWKRGIFRLETLQAATAENTFGLQTFFPLVQNYFEKFSNAFFPGLPVVAGVFAVALAAIALRKLPRDRNLFFLLWLLAPLFLFLLQFRSSYHTLIGLSIAFYGIFILAVQKIRLPFQRWLEVLFFSFFLIWNATQLIQAKDKDFHLAQTHDGSSLATKLQVIDATYQSAQGKPFSLSTATWPQGYNTTWAYLYHWYGNQQYGYTPQWYGPTQAGITGGEYLEETSQPLETHFSVTEYPESISAPILESFLSQQNTAGNVVTNNRFGFFQVEQR